MQVISTNLSFDTKLSAEPYRFGTIVEFLSYRQKHRLPLRIAFLDIDSTLSGSHKLINQVRQTLRQKGFAVIFVSARTEEMLMSSYFFRDSLKLGLTRPEPHLGLKNGRRFYQKTEEVIPKGLLDPEIIVGSSGTAIFIKQIAGGYLCDLGFIDKIARDTKKWRAKVFAMLQTLDPAILKNYLGAIEYEKNYLNGITDVYPPNLRIQLHFASLSQKLEVEAGIKKLAELKVVDDSHPQQKKYSFYIIPRHTGKGRAITRILGNLQTYLEIPPGEFEVIIAGDSYPDLEMGFAKYLQAKTIFLLVGKSRLAQALSEAQTEEFAGEDLRTIKQHLKKLPSGELVETQLQRTIIIGDKKYPRTKGAETVLSFLDQIE